MHSDMTQRLRAERIERPPSRWILLLLACASTAACTNANSPSRSESSGANSRTPSPNSPWVALRRPLQLNGLGDADTCHRSDGKRIDTGHASGFGLGPGPAYPILVTVGSGHAPFNGKGIAHYARLPTVGHWNEIKTLWTVDPASRGPILVRGEKLSGGGSVGFGVEGFGSVGGTVRTVGNLTIGTELELGEGSISGKGWREFPGGTFLPGPGCYALQIDGESFSYAVVFEAGP
jgi:hypothetical protein